MTSRGNWVRFVALAVLWGSSFLWIKLALGALTPVQISLVRMTIGALVILGLCLLSRIALPRDRSTWLRVLVPAFFGNALPFTLFGLGERTVDSGVAGVLNATTPIWTLIIALLVRSERRPTALRLTGLLLGLAGTLLIFAPWQASTLLSWGALACLGAAISYGVSYNYISRQLTGRISPVALAFAQLSLGGAMAAVALPVDWATPHPAALPLLAVVILGVLGTGVAFVWNNRLIADEGPTTAASLGYLLPPVSVLLGMLTLHEQLGPRVLAGMVVVLVGVGLSRRRPASTTRTQAPAAQPAVAEAATGQPG
jgi:drug/metabolite transporter (DMT)-like permease